MTTPSIDIDRIRRDTRACNDILHLNSAGSSLMPIPVSDALHAFLHQEEAIGGYETAAAQKAALDNFYTASAKLINCDPGEIAFVENATRAWDMAFYSFEFAPGDKILTSIAEYGSNIIAFIQQSKRYGVEVLFVPNDAHGQLDVAAMAEMVDEHVKLIAVSHIPTGGGLVNPVAEIGRIANEHNIPYLLDACQSLGQLQVDVQAIGCDMLSGTGRKYLRGPRGTGLLYVSKKMLGQITPAFLDQHAAKLVSSTEYEMLPDAKRFENWERYFAGQAALGVAIDYALEIGLDAIEARVLSLADTLRESLSEIDGVTIHDEGLVRCGLVTFAVEQMAAGDIKAALAKMQPRINVSTSSGSGSFVSFQQRGITELVRSSVHYFNTEAEIERFVSELADLLTA